MKIMNVYFDMSSVAISSPAAKGREEGYDVPSGTTIEEAIQSISDEEGYPVLCFDLFDPDQDEAPEIPGWRHISFIGWDVDEEDEDILDYLPADIYVPSGIEDEDVADYLSDIFGFCILGFRVRY